MDLQLGKSFSGMEMKVARDEIAFGRLGNVLSMRNCDCSDENKGVKLHGPAA